MTSKPLNSDTLVAHAGCFTDSQTGAVSPPINSATTFARNKDYSLVSDSHLYARDDNDLYRQIENLMAKLENGSDSRVFSSGMAAIAAIIRSVSIKAKIVVQSGIYWGTTLWIRQYCQQLSIELIETDATDGNLLGEVIRKNKPELVFLEFPSNPWLGIADIALAAKNCRKHKSCLVVDATVATPLVCRPLDLGAELVVHSATKALNGHSDVLAGVVTTRNTDSARWQKICNERKFAGAILGPFEAWLFLRGLRTLALRLNRMNSNALYVAGYLCEHRNVEQVYYPGLSEHPGYELACRQMHGGFGYLLSFTVKGDGKTALEVAGKLNLILRATSLGGIESLIEHRKSIEGPDSAIPDNLLRLSLGIENCEDIVDDLGQALDY